MSPTRRRSLSDFGERSRQVVVVDTETTGLGHNARPPRADGVVQIGYAWRNPRGQVIRWAATCNPGDSYLRAGRAADALAINGIRLSTVLSAPSARTVAAEFREHLDGIRQTTGREVEIRSYNRAFDEPFLSAKPWSLPSELWGPCLMQAAQDHLGLSRWPKLHVAVNYLGIMPPSGRSHTAAVDSHAALLVHERMVTLSHAGRLRR
jgi:DNA polymerase III epsilon subunit-like protein